MIPPLQAIAFTCPSLFLLTCHSISFWITTQLHLFYQVTHDIHTTNYHFKQYDHRRPFNVLRTKLKERRHVTFSSHTLKPQCFSFEKCKNEVRQGCLTRSFHQVILYVMHLGTRVGKQAAVYTPPPVQVESEQHPRTPSPIQVQSEARWGVLRI